MIDWAIAYLLIGVVLALPMTWFPWPLHKKRMHEVGHLSYILGGVLWYVGLWPITLVTIISVLMYRGLKMLIGG
mgnify:CR=1 FL=1